MPGQLLSRRFQVWMKHKAQPRNAVRRIDRYGKKPWFQNWMPESTRLFGLDAAQGKDKQRNNLYRRAVKTMNGQGTHLDAVQGAGEKRRELYMQYSERVSQPVTPYSAKNSSGAASSAGGQAAVVRMLAGGYTIIEVLIVLAISGTILVSSIGVFGGRKAATEFSQAVYDLQSKFQNYANSVSSAALPAGEAYTCQVSSLMPDGKVYPVLATAPAGSSDTTNQDCIYLGRAIQIIPGSDSIYNYPVFGLRTVHNGTVDTGDFPASVAAANPEPALDSSGNFLLVEQYQLLNGLSIVSATAADSGEQDLLTLYSSLQNNNTSGSQITASTRNYAFSSTDAKSVRLRSCIEGSSCGSGTEYPLIGKSWNLCVANSTGSKRAQLAVQGTATGITTRLNLEGCP